MAYTTITTTTDTLMTWGDDPAVGTASAQIENGRLIALKILDDDGLNGVFLSGVEGVDLLWMQMAYQVMGDIITQMTPEEL